MAHHACPRPEPIQSFRPNPVGGLEKSRGGDGEEADGCHSHEISGVNRYPRQGLQTGSGSSGCWGYTCTSRSKRLVPGGTE